MIYVYCTMYVLIETDLRCSDEVRYYIECPHYVVENTILFVSYMEVFYYKKSVDVRTTVNCCVSRF